MRIVIVDGYSTGSVLSRQLRDRGVSCLHVSSQPDMPSLFTRSFDKTLYETNLEYIEDEDHLAGTLRDLEVGAVVAGTESGVLLADRLNHLLGLPGHAWDTRHARRDKSTMAEVVTAAGLRAPRGTRFTHREEAVRWYDESRLGSVVVKPLASAGSDNVHFCDDSMAVGLACDHVVNGTNLYGEINGKGLIQERVAGTEFYVNSVSVDGSHTMVETWCYTKRGGHRSNSIYDFETPLDPTTPEAWVLHDFVSRVLSALGVHHGAAHTEVMLTTEGPVLIETGARLGGGTLPWVTEKYTGTSQTRSLARALTDGHAAGPPTEPAQAVWSCEVRNVNLINEKPGLVHDVSWVERIGSLPSTVAVVSAVTPGMHIEATSDLASAPGFAYLIHDDGAVVERDYATLRAWERHGLYTAT